MVRRASAQTAWSASAPPLFGHEGRTALLLYVAQNGPCYGRAAARAIGLEVAHTSRIITDFVRMGVLRRESGNRNRARLMLDESFFAFAELMALLRGMNGERVVVLGGPTGAPPSDTSRLLSIFGTPNRTRLLVALRAVGSATLNQLNLISGVSQRSGFVALDYLDSHGITKSERVGHQQRIAELDPGFRCHELLSRLLERLGDVFPQIVNAATFLREHVAKVESEQRLTAPAGWYPELMPLGEQAQAAVLYQLGLRGTLPTMALAKATNLTIDSTRSAILSLEAFRLVTQKTFGKGYHKKRWIALNNRHPLSAPIAAYSRDLAARYPAEPFYRLAPEGFSSHAVTPEGTPQLPGLSLRLRVLMAVFEHPGIDVRSLRIRLGEPDARRIKIWIHRLAASELIDCGMEGVRLVAAPNRTFHAAQSLATLVLAMSEFLGFNPSVVEKTDTTSRSGNV